MIKTDRLHQDRHWWQLPNLWLLTSLVSFFIVYPLLTRLGFPGYLFEIMLSGSIILALLAQSYFVGKARVVFLLSGVLAVLAGWLPLAEVHLEILVPVMYSFFFAFCLCIYCHKLFTESEVDVDTLLAGSCAYILLGFLFSTLYMFLWSLDPDSISLKETGTDPRYQLVYFSFVSLTTLGYGDVVPVTPSAQMLAVLEAITGQIFVTVVVAELVGIHVSRGRRPYEPTSGSADTD